MSLVRDRLRKSFYLFSLVLLSPAVGFPQATPMIAGGIDNSARVTLKGNVHRLAQPQFDRGAAPSDLAMDRMLLVLKRSPEQDAALKKLLDDQQDKSSPNYRKWLTPEQFGQKFGPADSDVQAITQWLQQQGFHGVQVNKGRTLVEFSGTASQVQNAFGTSIHKFTVKGQDHWANANEPSLPAALTPAVAGVWTLHNFVKDTYHHVLPQRLTAKAVRGERPQFTSSTGAHALTPGDYYKIYNIDPSKSASSLAIVARTNINEQDVGYFHYWMGDGARSASIVVNGPDPGNLGGGEEAEAVLDTTWAGAVAPNALLYLVVSQSTSTTDGVDLSEAYIIDHNLAAIMSESFGSCEANFTSTEAAGISNLAQQAAAQGITYVVASGDSGSAGCDDPNSAKVATQGLAVNMLASSPYVTAIGGTIFNENGNASKYWSSTNDPNTHASALSYIPEKSWNQSCTSGQTGCSQPGIWAGGGGGSEFFTKPSWQSGVPGIPSDNLRHLPDVSLTAATHDPYLICIENSCVPDANGNISFAGIGGTSASTPAFAAIFSMVSENELVRIGSPNFILYKLAASETLAQCNASSTSLLPAATCIFNDVTVGNNAVPGESGYGTSNPTYQAGVGYDQTTGLGSVNVTNFINHWNDVTFRPTTTNLSISPIRATHGDPITVSGNVVPTSGTGTPTGPVWITPYQYGLTGDSTVDTISLDNAGTFSGVTHLLPGGSYDVNAHYTGDETFGGSDSAPPVLMVIQPEATALTFSVFSTDANGNAVPISTAPYGTTVFYKAHVSGTSGYGTPTNQVVFMDGSSYGGFAYLDANGDAATVPTTANGGSHSITASYYGDNSFSGSTNGTPINFMITKGTSTTSLLQEQNSTIVVATVSAPGAGQTPSGWLTFSAGSQTLATQILNYYSVGNGVTQSYATFDASQLSAGQYNIVASYPGDGNYTASTSAPLALNLAPDFSLPFFGSDSQSVYAGSQAAYQFSVSPLFGYTGNVSLSCNVAAVGTKCSMSNNSWNLANGAGAILLAVSTTSRQIASATPVPTRFGAMPVVLSSAFAFFLCSFLLPVSRGRRARMVRTLSVFALIAVLFIGCGGSGSNTGSVGNTTNPNGTPAGTYPITVTATSGNLTHTLNLTLIVR